MRKLSELEVIYGQTYKGRTNVQLLYVQLNKCPAPSILLSILSQVCAIEPVPRRSAELLESWILTLKR